MTLIKLFMFFTRFLMNILKPLAATPGIAAATPTTPPRRRRDAVNGFRDAVNGFRDAVNGFHDARNLIKFSKIFDKTFDFL